MKKRPGKRKPPAPERAVAAFDALRRARWSEGLITEVPVILHQTDTDKWTVDPSTHDELIPVVKAVAAGKNRKAPRGPAHNSNSAVYRALRAHFSGANKSNLLVPPINAARVAQIESEVLRFNPKLNPASKKFAKFMGAYIKHLRGHT